MPQRANIHRFRRASLLLAVSFLVTAPLAAQQAASPPQGGAPKSLLPDDLAAPPPAPPVSQPSAAQPETAQQSPAGEILPGFEPFPASEQVAAAPLEKPAAELDPLALLAGPTTLPEFAGFLMPQSGGYAADIFSESNGLFLATLLNRIDAPLASRWLQIMVQRALVSRTRAPGNIAPADWVAARGMALAAMGAGADAHRLISSIAIDAYTERLYGAAAQAAFATADPMALCPLSPTARSMIGSPTWTLVDAMCLSILGDDFGASAMFDRLRRDGDLSAFDIGLAERVASTTGSGRRGANPEWGEAKGGLTAWRLGLASSAGLELPDEILETATPAQKAWIVRLPGMSIARRAGYAAGAAATGAISSAELGRIFAAEAAGLDQSQAGNSAGSQLRAAYVATDISARLSAMKGLWGRAKPGTAEQYGWQIATAAASARIPPSSGLADNAPALVASMNSAGITGASARWWQAAQDADSDVRAAIWAQLAAVSSVPIDQGLYDNWAGTVSRHRAQLLAAGLQGLGRTGIKVDIPVITNEWTAALDRAVASRHVGEVMLLAASGMQKGWDQVPPDYLRRVAAALTAVGHGLEARMIVAEAANRG